MRSDLGREPLRFVELLPDFCVHSYGTAPCTASGGPGSECYNTRQTCQDPANFSADISAVTSGIGGTDDFSVDFSGDWTVEVSDKTITPPTLISGARLFRAVEVGTTKDFELIVKDDLTLSMSFDSSEIRTADPVVTLSRPHKFRVKRNGNRAAAYIDGELVLEGDIGLVDISARFFMVLRGGATGEWYGAKIWPEGVGAALDPEYLDKLASIQPKHHWVAIEDAGATTVFDFGYDSAPITGQTQLTFTDSIGRSVRQILVSEPAERLPVGFFPSLHSRVSFSPTIIEPQKGLGQRASLSFKVADHPHHDAGFDPYRANRTYDTNQGTFWGKWLARNRQSYVGRPARLWIGYVDETIDFDNFERLDYLLHRIDGPDKRGEIKVTAKDPLKVLDDVLWPEPSLGELVNDIVIASATINVTGDTYDGAGHIRIGSEIIKYTANADNGDGTYTLTGLTRGAYGSEADDHDAGDRVQQCVEYDAVNPIFVLEGLLEAGGLPDFMRDQDRFDFHRTFWLAGSEVKNILSEPKQVREHIAELTRQYLTYIWWDDRANLIKIDTISPRPSTYIPRDVTDETELLADQTEVSDDLDAQLTRVFVAFNRIDATKSGEVTNYRQISAEIAADVENADRYGAAKPKVIYADWIGNPGDAFTLAQRNILRYKNGQRRVEFALDASIGDVWVSDIVRFSSSALQGVTGAAEPLEVQIIRAKEDGNSIQCVGVTTEYEQISSLYAPDATPDYASATDEDKETYAFYTKDDGDVVTGVEGVKYV